MAMDQRMMEDGAAAPPLPYRLRKRPRHGALPIPYLVAILGADGTVDPQGTPDFRIADPERVARCMRERRCGLCGQTLERTMVFIGGPGIKEGRLSSEPPAHEECTRYALMACPYLAGRRARRVDEETRERLHLPVMENLYERADEHGLWLLWTESYRLWQRPQTGVVYYACAPWLKVEEIVPPAPVTEEAPCP